MAKITYLLGAGASANTIPVVNQMRKRISAITKLLKGYSNGGLNPSNTPQKLHINHAILDLWVEDMEWLLAEAGLYYSIDTLARKYYLTAQIDKLDRLKWCVILYFTIEQSFFLQSSVEDEFKKEEIDNRYDSFFATIGTIKDKSVHMNSDIKIISWNYDVQIELCLKRFFNLTVMKIKDAFNIHPNNYSVAVSKENLIDPDKFGVVKLNGNAFWTRLSYEANLSIFDSANDDVDNYTKPTSKMQFREYVAFLVKEYGLWGRDIWNHKFRSYFNFAWEVVNKEWYETYKGHANIINEAERISEETEILVVIGYSFPIFNREIDKRLFEKMSKLKKVYIQDVNPDRIKSTMVNAFEVLQQTEIVNKLTGARPLKGQVLHEKSDYANVPKIDIRLETNLNQFVIPYELNQ